MTKIKHGHFVNGKQSPEYRAWAAMLRRVRNPKNNRFQYYGAKGIKVCERWFDFSNFLSDMGLKPSPTHSLERKDGSRDYEPGNCCWAIVQEQNWNKSNNIRIHVDGQIKSVRQCVSEYGIKATTIRDRLQMGWKDDDAVKRPLRI